MINFMFCEFLPQNKNVELQEEGKKKKRDLDKDTEGRSVSRLEMTGIQLAEIQSGRGESRAR